MCLQKHWGSGSHACNEDSYISLGNFLTVYALKHILNRKATYPLQAETVLEPGGDLGKGAEKKQTKIDISAPSLGVWGGCRGWIFTRASGHKLLKSSGSSVSQVRRRRHRWSADNVPCLFPGSTPVTSELLRHWPHNCFLRRASTLEKEEDANLGQPSQPSNHRPPQDHYSISRHGSVAHGPERMANIANALQWPFEGWLYP